MKKNILVQVGDHMESRTVEMTTDEIADIERENRDRRHEDWINSLSAVAEVNRVEISREDFDLLDVTDSNTIYTIFEEDGSVTVRKGED